MTLHSVPFQDLSCLPRPQARLKARSHFGTDKAFGKRFVSGGCLVVRAGFSMLRKGSWAMDFSLTILAGEGCFFSQNMAGVHMIFALC